MVPSSPTFTAFRGLNSDEEFDETQPGDSLAVQSVGPDSAKVYVYGTNLNLFDASKVSISGTGASFDGFVNNESYGVITLSIPAVEKDTAYDFLYNGVKLFSFIDQN